MSFPTEIPLSRLAAFEQRNAEKKMSRYGDPREILIRRLKRFADDFGFSDEEAHAVYFKRYKRMEELGLGWLANEMQAEEAAMNKEQR